MAMSRRSAITKETAETMAIQALAFLATEPERLGRFLAVTGIGPEGIRSAAREAYFLAGVLDYLVSDEPLLIAFAAQAGIDPADIAHASSVLGRGLRERELP